MIPKVTRHPEGYVVLHVGKKGRNLSVPEARALAARLLCASNAEAQSLVDIADDAIGAWKHWCELTDQLPGG